MWTNTKLLIISCISIIIFGVGLVFIGEEAEQPLAPVTQNNQTSPTPLVEANIASSSALLGIEGEQVLVTKVVDGDTIELENGQTVRFIGIDTPETKDPRRPVGCFGKEASKETTSLLLGKKVILQKDVSETDKYKRLLRLVYLPLENNQTLFVNDYLVREGFAKVSTYPPDVKFQEQFLQAEKQARENKKGLWGKCNS